MNESGTGFICASSFVRVVVYARYSTDEQRPESIEDQLVTCRRYCATKGWHIVGIYADAAMSGSTAQRPEFERLKRDSELRKFDVVVVEAIDRLSRRVAHVAAFHDLLSFQSQKLYATDKGEINAFLAGIYSAIGQEFLVGLKEKTKRGLRGKILSGLSAGGLGYGYVVDRLNPGVRRIEPAEADVIRRIFALYASGSSPRTIASTLNKEMVPGPGGRPWGDTTIRGQVDRGTGLLNNAAYVGRLEWNRCTYMTDPSTGNRVARPNPRDRWEIMEAPELRIVDDGLWNRVKTQQNQVRTKMARDEDGQALNRAHRAKHFLSGLIVCGECGEPYAIRNATQYGCRNHRSKGTCGNRSLVHRKDLEGVIAEAMKAQWLTLANIEQLHAEMEAAQLRGIEKSGEATATLRAVLAQTQARIERIVAAIGDAGHSDALVQKLKDLEANVGRIKEEMAALEADTIPEPPIDRDKVVSTLQTVGANLHLIFDEVEDPVINDFKTKVRDMIEKIVVQPQDDGPVQFKIHGRFAGVMQAAGLLETYEPETRTAPTSCDEGAVVSVVAGTGFEPVTFRL